jgi:hypothetical protein
MTIHWKALGEHILVPFIDSTIFGGKMQHILNFSEKNPVLRRVNAYKNNTLVKMSQFRVMPGFQFYFWMLSKLFVRKSLMKHHGSVSFHSSHSLLPSSPKKFVAKRFSQTLDLNQLQQICKIYLNVFLTERICFNTLCSIRKDETDC